MREDLEIVVDGVMYLTTDTATYAVDAATCSLRWRRGTGQKPSYLRVNRVAVDADSSSMSLSRLQTMRRS